MGKSILVTGGTGTLGSALVPRLRAADDTVAVLSRRPGDGRVVGDLRTRRGVADAVAGVEVIVHCATTGSGQDVTATRNLVELARRVGRPHLVYISIVGIDRIPLAYYRTKLEAERLVIGSGLPWTILRTTQFHDLIAKITSVQRRSPVVAALSGVRFQPISVQDVAERLAELAAAEHAGRVPDMGGPQVRGHEDLTRAYLRAADLRRAVVRLRPPGALFRALRSGANLVPDRAVGRGTFEDFLSGA
ncbi:NAD-dependent epimerase/dehydratase family protein [Saccharopolyspora rhizosphaerae]|uniref:NAD-dependent epimerase/dehydratase family protein n=1 Tax=Saccharopolyspora rhizosphaerae TaxID=2492662 RepID=A0A426JNP9_9PSEU|nr:NAD(P)H-binding protein [Saccharopolyspora rhizosphaerae]RRO14848.1 NAD-dependent epimerase/dehydratase family protein [Saccharopolyspora rhizosphaerae]